MKNVYDFAKAYNQALEDDFIIEDEQINLTILWDKIYDESYAVAL